MDLSKLKYTKGDSAKEALPKSQIASRPGISGSERFTERAPLSPSYTKEDGILSTNLVFVLSGGEKREKDFLKELIVNRTIHSLRVAFMSEKGQGLQPYQMKDRVDSILATGIININGVVYHIDAMDKLFMLTDVDEFYDQLIDIERNAEMEWIISNPCFEIWLYYCYLNNPEKDLGELRSLHAASRSQRIKTLGNGVVPGGLNPIRAFEKMQDGIKHSLSHYSIDEHGIPVLFATDMHKMAQYLIDTMNACNQEYVEYVKRKAEWRELMRLPNNQRSRD